MEIIDADEKHCKDIRKIYAPYIENSYVSFETSVPSAEEINQRRLEIAKEYPYLVAIDGDQVIGYSYASKHRSREAYRWAVETSIYVAAQTKKSGVGRKLYSELFRRLKMMGLVHAYAGISLPNPESVGFHEACGFKKFCVFEKIGFKNDRWVDVGWWRLGLNETAVPPAEVRKYSEIEKSV